MHLTLTVQQNNWKKHDCFTPMKKGSMIEHFAKTLGGDSVKQKKKEKKKNMREYKRVPVHQGFFTLFPSL